MVTVTQSGKYNNISLKTFKNVPGMAQGETITMTKGKFPKTKFMEKPKVAPDGKAYLMKMWLCSAIYDGQEVSFFLWTSEEADAFDAAGETGDNFTCTMTLKGDAKKPGVFKEHLVFKKVQ